MLFPITVYIKTEKTEDTLGHTTVPKTNYLRFHEPTEILAAALYYQRKTQFVASGSTFLVQPEIQCVNPTSTLPKPKHHDNIIQNQPQSAMLITTFHHNYLTLRKYKVDCAHFSSKRPDNLTSNVRTIENMSIFPIKLKLGLCNNFSICSGNKLNGYCNPAF